MSDARFVRDPLFGWWTILAPARAGRPVDPGLSTAPVAPTESREEGAEDCPFCPGGEGELDEILEELPGPEGGWAARAVRNRYPFLSAPLGHPSSGPHLGNSAPAPSPGSEIPAWGHQEVLIESPRHGADLATLTTRERRTAIELWWRRLTTARQAPGQGRPLLFRNRGRDAGSSRVHPHAQLVQVIDPPGAPAPLRARLEAHHRETGRCAPCAIRDGAGERRVTRTGHFDVVTLSAPLDPFHLRIVPRHHAASFVDASSGLRSEFAELLGRVLQALDAAADRPAWNLLLHDTGPGEGVALHWHVEVRPRFSRTAGFELSTGWGVCPLHPAEAALRLRTAMDAAPPGSVVAPDSPHANPETTA